MKLIISRARYMRDMAALRAETERIRAERDTALEERNAFQAAAKTSAAHFVQADAEKQLLADAEKRRTALSTVHGEVLVEGGRTGRPVSPTIEAARERGRARALEERLAVLQAVNMRCTCGAGEAS